MQCIFIVFTSLIFFIFFNIFAQYNQQTISVNYFFSTAECSLSNLIKILTLSGFILGSMIFVIIYVSLYLQCYKLKRKLQTQKNTIHNLKLLINNYKKHSNTK